MRIDMSPFDKIEQKLHCLGAKKKVDFSSGVTRNCLYNILHSRAGVCQYIC